MKDDSVKNSNTGNTGHKSLAEEILDTLWEPLLVLEDDLRVKSANDAFYHHFKVEPAATVGRQVYDLGNGLWDIPLLRELLEEVLPEETSLRNFEIQHTFEQIGQRTLVLNARRIDHLELILLAMEDITDRKKNEALQAVKEVAEESHRTKSQFMANMSHEIRTPMTVFLSALELLLQLNRDPEHRKILEMADQSAQRLRVLLDDLLDFSRIESRKVEIEEKPFDPRQCVREAVEMFTLLAQEKSLEMGTEVAADTPETVIGDSNRVGQVLINLISNAVKFTHEGEVRVCVRSRGDVLEFSVADTGIGIPEDKLDLLFQSFSQVDASVTRRYGGTGLGLAISKGLVELMGGEIAVQSRKGEGSVFTFSLPLKTVEQSRPTSGEA